jgi:hypothetical protein
MWQLVKNYGLLGRAIALKSAAVAKSQLKHEDLTVTSHASPQRHHQSRPARPAPE